MKKIIITENQYKRIFTENTLPGSAPNFDNGSVKDFSGKEENAITVNVTSSNGLTKRGKGCDSDKIGKIFNKGNNYWFNTNRY